MRGGNLWHDMDGVGLSPATPGKAPNDLQFSGPAPDGFSATVSSNHSPNAMLRLSPTDTQLGVHQI